MNEFDIIRHYFDDPNGDATIGIGDDAAVISPPAGVPLSIAVDTLIEGVHFYAGSAAADIGYRALAVNLSDLAAMAATPKYYTLALTIPQFDEDWLHRFSAAMHALAREHAMQLIGGDTTRGALSITVQVIGYQHHRAITRRGGHVGDQIVVSGSLGDAAAGLHIDAIQARGDTAATWLRQRFLRPKPRISLGQSIADTATAAIDVSDGLVGDAGHIADASGCAARIDANKLPLSQALLERFGADKARILALTGGDDYELCFTVPLGTDVGQWEACTVIGELEAGTGVVVDNAPADFAKEQSSYQHFR